MEPATDTSQEAQADEGAYRWAAGAAPPVVLLVDDDADVLGLVRRQITRYGCRVLAAGSPEEAQALAATAGPVDLLVTDVMMPGTPGPELFRRLVGMIPGLKVIYMSGCPETALQFREIGTHGARFLAKPFSARDMAIELRKALGAPPASPP